MLHEIKLLFSQQEFNLAESKCLEYIKPALLDESLYMEECRVYDFLMQSALKNKNLDNIKTYIDFVTHRLTAINHETHRRECCELLKILAEVHRSISEKITAINYAKTAYEYACMLNDSQLIMDCAQKTAYIYNQISDYKNALLFYNIALDAGENSENTEATAKIIGSMGGVYLMLSDYSTALEYFANASNKLQNTQDVLSQSYYLGNIGVVYIRLRDYTKAEFYYNKALQVAEAHDLQPEIARHYGNLGNVCAFQNQFEKAIEYYRRSLEISIQCDYHTGTRRMYGNLGSVYLSIGNYAESLLFFQKALYLAETQNSVYGTAMQYGNLAKLFCEKAWEQYSIYTGLEYAKKSEEIFRELGTKDELMKVYELLSNIFAELKDWELHSQYQKLYYELQKEVYTEETKQKLQNTTLVLMEKQQQILTQKNAALEKLLKEKDEFLSIASHDLKNPLHSIQLIAQYLMNYPNEVLAEREQMYADILKSSKKMFAIISEYLNAHRGESSDDIAKMKHYILNTLLSNVVQNFKITAQEKNISIVVAKAPDSLYVYCDENKFIQIMDNIISNALKFSPFHSEIHVVCSFKEQTIKIEVRDHGPGLTDKDKEKLFTKYATLSARPTNNENSTGLGLYIAKQLVEKMGGIIYCHSSYGNGCSFFIELSGYIA